MNDTEDEPEAPEALHWDGVTLRSSYSAWASEARDRIAMAAHASDWRALIALLTEHPAFVNGTRLESGSRFAPLHQAAYAGAPADIVEWLIASHAWRTLRNAKGERAIDVAKRRGHATKLGALLEPRIVAPIPIEPLVVMQARFHLVIAERAAREVHEHALRLPELETMTEFELGRKFWFAVPGMMGGFVYWLEAAGDAPCLVSESWVRCVDGSGQRHRVTPGKHELVAEGFV